MTNGDPIPNFGNDENQSIEEIFGEMLTLRPDLQREVDAATMREFAQWIDNNAAVVVNFLEDNLVDVDGLRELLIQMSYTDNREARQFTYFMDNGSFDTGEMSAEMLDRLNRLMQMGQAVKTMACAMTGVLHEAQKQVSDHIMAGDKLTEDERKALFAAADTFLDGNVLPDTDIAIRDFDRTTDPEYKGIDVVAEVAGKLFDTTLGAQYRNHPKYSVIVDGVKLAALTGTTAVIEENVDKALAEIGILPADYYETADQIIDYFNDYR